MKKLLIFTFLFFIMIISCRELTNVLDYKSDNYIGVASLDLDGDGIGQYEDVDEIELFSLADGAVLKEESLEFSTNEFNSDIVTKFGIQIASTNDFIQGNIIFEQDDFATNKFFISLENFINNATYYWRAKAFDGTRWSDHWSESRSFTLNIDVLNPQTLFPLDGSTITDLTPLLDWTDIIGAMAYHVQVNTLEDFTSML